MKYAIRTTAGNSFVKELHFTKDGIVINYTPDVKEAGKVSIKEVANNLAKCTPLGKAVVVNE